MISRRNFLIGGSGGALLIASGGLVWHGARRNAFSRASGKPWEIWQLWDDPQYQGTPTAIAIAGMMAANPHNTQPWIFEIFENFEVFDREEAGGDQDGQSGKTIIRLYADERRNLGTFDPYLREMHIGLGCAIENMLLAAPAHGFTANIDLASGLLRRIPQNPREKLIAQLILTPAQKSRDELYDAIGQRRTNRGAYLRDKPIADEAVRLFESAARAANISLTLISTGRARRIFDMTTNQATQNIIQDKEMVADSHHWFRALPQDIENHRDGVTLDSVGLSPLILTAAKMLPPLSSEESHQAWADATREVHLATAPMVGIISVRSRLTVRNSLAAGQLWQRLHLMAVNMGIDMHPINQAVERIDRARMLKQIAPEERPLQKLVKTRAEPTFIFRMGYAERPAHPSPRRSIQDTIRN